MNKKHIARPFSRLLLAGMALSVGLFFQTDALAEKTDSLEDSNETLRETGSVGFEGFVMAPPEWAGSNYAWKWRADESAWKAGRAMRKTDRGAQASADAAMIGEDYLKEVGKILNIEISEKATPATHALLSHSFKSALNAVTHVKAKFRRPRPYVSHPDDETCNPQVKERLNAYASYPSGHTILAWTIGLVVSALVPEKAEPILKRAYEMGESRWICGHHWASDVQAGRDLASATVAHLLSDPEYLKLFSAAKKEMEQKLDD